ncbi:MAG TPA: right-handed parallel beta-helix repeat-containing protein, partial [Solirubrobacterales bacterium]|nr:right-handed parallel beta-helix repeat-containing protein [Solirubrobacterales bacterium]
MDSRRRPGRSLTLLALLLLGAAVALTLLLALRDEDSAPISASSAAARTPACAATVASLGAVQAAVDAAEPGSSVCLRDGEYGELSLSAEKSGGDVVVRAENPGKATLAGADLRGSHLALAHFDIAGGVTIEPGSRKISVLHNRIHDGYFGVEAGPTTNVNIADTTIRGNKFVGPFGEDAIRLNRYHDSGDPDPYGVLIEGNEITNVRENGNHSDCLQSVWGGNSLYFRRNYLHDNRCQGFFINDQPAPVRKVVIENNLMLRNAAPCDPPGSQCGPPLILQIIGPTRGIRLARNTVWTPEDDSPVALREGPFGAVAVRDNVIFRGWSDWEGGFPRFREAGNLVCRWESTLPRLSSQSRRSCRPGFLDPAKDDYRVEGGPGVTWAPAGQHYGP